MKLRLLGIALFITLASMLATAGSTCALSTQKAADGTKNDFDFVAGSGDLFYTFRAVAGRSYSVEVLQDFDDQNTDLTVTLANPSSACGSLTQDGTAVDTHLIEPALPNNASRFSIPSASAGDYHIQIHNSGGSGGTTGHYVAVTVSDTTIFGSSWSTNLGYVAEWIWQNTTNTAITGKVTITDNSVSPATTSSNTITIPAGGQANYIIGPSSILGVCTTTCTNAAANHSGFMVFTHAGPPGAFVTSGYYVNVSNGTLVPTAFAPARSGSHE